MNKTKLIIGAAAAFGGVIGFFILLLVLSQEGGNSLSALLVVGGIIFAGIAVCFGTDVLVTMFNTRRRAMKAIGKGGINIVMKDKTAKIAYKGICKFLDGDMQKAEEYLTKAHSLADVRNNQLFCLEWLGRLYEEVGDEAKILWCHRKAVDYAPDVPSYQSRLGFDYFRDGKLDKAMYCFEQAVKYDPNDGFSRYNIACIKAIRGDEEQAIEDLKTLAGIQENHPLVFAELATIYAMRGDKENCREAYDKAILCGYNEPDRLSEKITAIFAFNANEHYSWEDLPRNYYRYIPEKEDKRTSCGHECEYCMLNKKEEDKDDAGDE